MRHFRIKSVCCFTALVAVLFCFDQVMANKNKDSSSGGSMGSSRTGQHSSLSSSEQDSYAPSYPQYSPANTNYQHTRPSKEWSDSSSSNCRGLPSLDGVTHGLGLRKRRAVSNKLTNKKPTVCQDQNDPVCGSDGKTYSNKCAFQCQIKKLKLQSKEQSKNSKKSTKIPSLKIVKKGNCTTTDSPTDMVTELTGTVNGTLSEHLPLKSMATATAPEARDNFNNVRKH